MRTNKSEEIARALAGYNNLQECVIETMALEDYGTTVEIVFDYIWNERGELREDLDQVRRLIVRFRRVQRFHLENALNPHMSEFPEELNWGLNEIAAMRLVEGDDLATYREFPVPFHRLEIVWEGRRHIDLIFSELEVTQDW
jgi:hypothetical protein